MFSSARTAQVCAEFTRRAGGTINVLKLVKLVYLCDRMSMKQYASPITYDRYASMDHGPVPSNTLNLINGRLIDPAWNKWMENREGYTVSVRRQGFVSKDLDELSVADLEIMDKVWDEFGDIAERDLSRYTHEHCTEWEDPGGSSTPIEEWEIFLALGWNRRDAESAHQQIQEQREIDRVLSQA